MPCSSNSCCSLKQMWKGDSSFNLLAMIFLVRAGLSLAAALAARSRELAPVWDGSCVRGCSRWCRDQLERSGVHVQGWWWWRRRSRKLDTLRDLSTSSRCHHQLWSPWITTETITMMMIMRQQPTPSPPTPQSPWHLCPSDWMHFLSSLVESEVACRVCMHAVELLLIS